MAPKPQVSSSKTSTSGLTVRGTTQRRRCGTSGLAEQSLNEKRRFFAAVAKLCGESALEPLRRELTGKEDRWFTSKKDKELAEALAHGIRVIGTDAALTFLRQLAEDGPRFVKTACAKELG